MLKKICDIFSGVKATAVSGIFLLISLILMLTKTKLPLDPAWVTVLLSGYPLLYLAISRLFKQKWISSCLLISIAMAASLAIGELFAAGEVAFIMAVGAILEDMTVNRAKKGLSALMSLTPTEARLLIHKENGFEEKTVSADKVRKGDLIRILPGEKIPADGIIVSGETSVDQSVITGESLPVDKSKGDAVFCGTLNCCGAVDAEVTEAGKDSSVQKLISMVKDAEKNKAPIQRIADKWSVWLVPIALGIAVLGFIINFAMGTELMAALKRGVTVLVVFCPCALALATPTSVMAAIGKGTKNGIIIKSGEALETMGRADVIAFDKTGTLTYGKLRVTDTVVFSEKYTEMSFLSEVSSAEEKSEHPLAKAINEYAKEKGLERKEAEDFRMQAGCGISAVTESGKIFCGSEKYLNRQNIFLTEAMKEKISAYRREGKALVLAGRDSECIGFIALSDTLRDEAPHIIKELDALNVRTVLLTGDNKNAAEHFGKKVGISEVRSELLPDEKVNALKEIKESGKTVCMLGDGINDAPALKTADAGIAMGEIGSDIAVEAADAVLVRDKLSQLVYLKKLAQKTLSTIKFNITASMCINAVAVALSVLGVLNPVTGALVHNAGSFLVVLNAALLYDRKIK